MVLKVTVTEFYSVIYPGTPVILAEVIIFGRKLTPVYGAPANL